MSRASISTGVGPGSSVSLAPETIRIRDALIKKFMDEPLDEMNQFMSQALQKETDDFRRLGILAARIYILRHRIANIQEFNRDPTLTAIPEITTASLNTGLPGFDETATADSGDSTNELDIAWTKVKMLEAGEVNGVRFLAGTFIDAKKEDAEKLLASGRAVCIDEDGNEIAIGENALSSADTGMAETEVLSEQDDAPPTANNSAGSTEDPSDDIDDGSDSKAEDIDDAPDSEAEDIDDAPDTEADDVDQGAAEKPDDAKTPSS